MRKIEAIRAKLPEAERDALDAHITGGTSAAWIAKTLSSNRFPIGATAIKEERKRLNGGM